MRAISFITFSFLVLALAGCRQEPDAPSLEIGTGESSYQAFEDGDTLAIVAGCQGAQHIWVALRGYGLEPRGTLIDLSLRRVSDGALVSQPFFVRVSLQDRDAGYGEVTGLTLVVPEPEDAIGFDLELFAEVEDRDGVLVREARLIRADWGPGGCRRPEPEG